MKRDEAIAILTTHQDEIESFGVKSLAIFGSVARDEARSDSDVDLLVEFQEGKQIDFPELVELHQYLESLLGREVDILNPKSLKNRMRQRVFYEAVCAFPHTNSKIYQSEVVGRVPPRSWTERIEDILEAIADIESFIAGITFEEFEADKKTVNAVARSITILGEAARYTPSDVEAANPQIPWAQMRGIRNVIVHEYSKVDLPTVWNVIQNQLPPLAIQLRELLEKSDL